MWMIRLQRIACLPRSSCAASGFSRQFSSSAPTVGAAAAAEEKATVKDDSGAAAAAAADAVEETVRSTSSWRGLKALLGLTATAAVGGVSYVTYAYSIEDVERIVKPWRQQPAATTASEDYLQRMYDFLYTRSCQAAVKGADMYLDLRRSLEEQVRGFAAPSSDKLLPDLIPQEQHVYTIVLDLNETLVFSEWKRERGWGTFKRPGVEAFLEKLANYYEIVVYSDQMSFYVDPVLERLDQKGCIRYRLARDATYYVDGKHFRDLSKLNRDPKKVMYISGHALETCLQPENAVPIKPWKMENDDTALLDLLPFLEFVARQRPPDVRTVLESYKGRDIATEFRERAKQNQRRVQERKQQGQGRFWRGV